MKLLLFCIAIVVLLWLLRGTLATWRGERDAKRPPKGPGEGAEEMLRCAECGLHLPAHDALPGKGGVFCSEAHRVAHESRLPGSDDRS